MSDIISWREEKQSAHLYGLIARHELDPIRKKLFVELAKVAEKQASIWEKKCQQDPKFKPIPYRPDFRTRIVGMLLSFFSVKQIRFILSAMKVRGMSIYATAPSSHAEAGHLEHRHKGLTTAGNLRAAVFGVNDGLVSNLSLLCGMMGGGAGSTLIILSGTAGLLAGACSMAAGEYISMRSQREFFEYQIALEKEELELYPEEEAAELACIYRARGMTQVEADQLANNVVSNPKTALNTLAREELGLDPAELGSPLGAAISSFLAFGIGALIPLFPFFILQEVSNGFLLSIALTIVALYVIGCVLSLYTNRSGILGGLRMLLIGGIAAVITFVIGKLLGVALV